MLQNVERKIIALIPILCHSVGKRQVQKLVIQYIKRHKLKGKPFFSLQKGKLNSYKQFSKFFIS